MPTNKKIGLFVAALIMLAGLAAWAIQLKEGLVLTHMRNSYTWGLYVSSLAFFVGNAAGGLVLSSMIYLFGVTSLKPFAKIGALCAFANVTAAMLAIIPDIGQPIRLYNMLLHPQWRSPLVWDVIVLNLYAVLSLLYLYLLMLPDLEGPLKRIAIPVSDRQEFSEKWARRLAPFSLVAAVGIHVITAWIFATQGARDWWNSAVLAPDFVAAALASGTAIVLIVCILAYGIKEEYSQSYRALAIFISVAYFIHVFFMYNDFLIHFWYGATDALEVLTVVFKDYLLAHAFEVIAPLAGVILLLNRQVRKSAGTMITSCLLVVAGIFVHRFLLMPAAFDKVPLTITPLGLQNMEWSVPIASGNYQPLMDTFVTEWHYFPSGVEMAIMLGVGAYVAFLLLLAIDRLPIINSDQTEA
jgi:molybdopterin-containing oxidoreductase family membrane subunit